MIMTPATSPLTSEPDDPTRASIRARSFALGVLREPPVVRAIEAEWRAAKARGAVPPVCLLLDAAGDELARALLIQIAGPNAPAALEREPPQGGRPLLVRYAMAQRAAYRLLERSRAPFAAGLIGELAPRRCFWLLCFAEGGVVRSAWPEPVTEPAGEGEPD